MKKWGLVLAAGMAFFCFAGCGGAQKTENAGGLENVAVVEEQADYEQSKAGPAESEVEEKNDNFNDLKEKGDSGEITAFAGEIQTAVSDKDIEALADLCIYPLAVNGEAVESKEDFLKQGKDVIFTEERCAAIMAVDVSTLEETMAGIIMGDATPNIIFQSVDGKLGITGIN